MPRARTQARNPLRLRASQYGILREIANREAELLFSQLRMKAVH